MAKKGVEHHNAKLNPDLVRQIRAWRAEGWTYYRILEGLDWAYSSSTINAVLTGKTWRHVQGP